MSIKNFSSYSIKGLFILIFILFINCTSTDAQSPVYYSGGTEVIFSFADLKDNGHTESTIIRFAPVFNPQLCVNKDVSKRFGLFTGLNVKNIGYIYDSYHSRDPNSQAINKKKFRTYNIGIPIGIKIGNLDKTFLFGGYEVEFPIHYKEKTFDSGDKISKTTGWFSPKVVPVQHGFLVGIHTKSGVSIKFKYYLSEFHNQNYTDANGVQLYKGLDAHVFYFSLGSYFAFSSKPKNKSVPVTKTTDNYIPQ